MRPRLGETHQRAALFGVERRFYRRQGLPGRITEAPTRPRFAASAHRTISPAERAAHAVSPSPNRPTLRAS